MREVSPPKPDVKPEQTAEESAAARKAYYAASESAPSSPTGKPGVIVPSGSEAQWQAIAPLTPPGRPGNTLQVALDYLVIFPTHRIFSIAAGMKSPPCFPGYAMKASGDPKVIERMHHRYRGCSWGLAPAKSDVIVIDADLKKGKFGQRSLDALELMYGPLPPTSVVISPSGGKHFRFQATNYVRHRLKLNGFGQHLDCPAYTLIPGNQLAKGGTYRLVDRTPLAPAPSWLADVLGEDRERALGGKLAPVCELDTDTNIGAATELLQHYASTHPAIQGEGGDAWTYQVACQVGDLGISESVCLDLMFEFFNPSCIPQWEAEGPSKDLLATKIRSAYSSRESPVGFKTAEAEFGSDPPPELTPADVEAARRVQDEREQARILAAELAQEESDV